MQSKLLPGSFDGMGHLLILLTLGFTVYGQLITKQQVSQLTGIPSGLSAAPYLVWQILTRPLLLSGFVAAFCAALCWMGAVARFNLSYAYPFMSLNFVLVGILSAVFFSDAFTVPKVLGLTLICLGVFVTARG
jgi:uncharacterized membrane protein